MLYDGGRGRGGGGGHSSVVRASEFKTEDPGFDPLVEQGEGQFFCPPELNRVQTCLCLSLLLARTQVCVHVKDTISICREIMGLTVGGMETGNTAHRKHRTQETLHTGNTAHRKHCTQEKKKRKNENLGSDLLWLLAFPGESRPNCPCIALEQDSYVM